MLHAREVIKEVCHPHLIQHLVCEEICRRSSSTDSTCADTCVEAAQVAVTFRERFCHLFTGVSAPTSTQCPETCLLARSFVHLQSWIVLSYSSRAAYSAWKTNKTWGAFLKSASVPVLGITLGLSGLAVASVL